MNKKIVLVHRFAYEQLVGRVPEGLQLDHVRANGCKNRCCVNPDHLEPVTARENLRRSDITVASINAAKTSCKWGHPLVGENVYWRPDGYRDCRTCRRSAMMRYKQGHAILMGFREAAQVAA